MSKSMISMELRVNVRKALRGKGYISDITAHPAPGKSDAKRGSQLASMRVDFDGFGAKSGMIGTGLPIELRLLIPEFPRDFRKKNGWTEKIKVKHGTGMIEIELKHKIAGYKKINKRKCLFIQGKGGFADSGTARNDEAGINAEYKFKFDYEENYYIDTGRGVIARTEVIERRARSVFDNISGTMEMDETDLSNKMIDLVAVK